MIHSCVDSLAANSILRLNGGQRVVICVAAFLMIAALAGADDPQIVRVIIPAKEVSKHFPPGTELRVMPAGEFDALVAKVQNRSIELLAAGPPRMIRATHHARLRSGILVGRSEVVIESARSGAADFVLEPWTPAILATPQVAQILGARDSGKTSLWIDQAPSQTIVLEWELQPRAGKGGRSFSLALPGNETTVLTLELPRNWVPSCRRGIRRGPEQGREASDEDRWEVEPEEGRIDVQIYEAARGETLVQPSRWLTGSTEIDLRRSADRGGGLVNWRAELRVELDPRNPGPLEIELDSGLELIDVLGPAVRGYHTERLGTSSRLYVNLDGGLESSIALGLRAHAQVPSEGNWMIPGLRAKNAVWTGGTTTVYLDEFHVLKECREISGRRTFPSSRETVSVDRLDFESGSSRSVAQLVFRKPRADASCEVRGRLFLAGSLARLECDLNWSLHDGSMADLEIDLSPAWLPEKVAIEGLDDPVAWHPSVLPSGITRLHLSLPEAIHTQKQVVIKVGANSSASSDRGPLQLPRVRPVASRIVDEAWVARVDPGTMIQPTKARGLAWIDPAQVPGLLAASATASDLREALAWRWIASAAEARVDRERIELEPGATVRIHARIDPTLGRLILDGQLLLYAGAGPIDSVPLWINQAGGLRRSWRFQDEDGAVLTTQAVADSDRTRLGFPKEGIAVLLQVAVAAQTQKTVSFHAEYSWETQGPIPLVSLGRKYLSRGMVVCETPAGLRSRTSTAFLRRLDGSTLEQADFENGEEFVAESRDGRVIAKNATIEAFSYSEPGSLLELYTEPLLASETTGIVREAILTTLVDPKGTLLNRLRLFVNLREARSLKFDMPHEISIVRVQRDGTDVAAFANPTGFALPVAGAVQGPRSSTIVIDYVVPGRALADGAQLRPALPRVDLPCVSFVWEVVTSPAWRADDAGPGLVAGDRDDFRAWPYAVLGVPTPLWTTVMPRRGHPKNEQVLRLLDDKIADREAAELTFAEWFTRWDSGEWPVIIDREALSALGLGPKSQCVPPNVKTERRNLALATLKQYGLAIAPLENVLVITTQAELSRLETPDCWTEQIRESLVWGASRSDRFQSVARWRGEASPRIVSVIGEETPERIKLPPGWSAWSFAGPAWPDGDSYVRLVNLETRIVTGWIIAAMCILVWVSYRSRLVFVRYPVLTATMILCLFCGWLLPSRYANYSAAVYTASFAILISELGRDCLRSVGSGRAARRPDSGFVRRARGAAVSVSLAALLMNNVAPIKAAAPADRQTTILALFPYDGPFDPSRSVTDVILRFADFARLKRMAESEVPQVNSSVRAIGTIHRVIWKSALEVIVESEIELVAVGRGPFVWRLPVSQARDIQTVLDGKRVPIAIEAGGALGKVEILEAGTHLLQVRRSSVPANEDGNSHLVLPVNAIPSARVVVQQSEGSPRDVELTARGKMKTQPDGSLTALLGPDDRIEVRWGKSAGASVVHAPGIVDGLILWDITPAGDRVRARFTVHQPRPLSTFRFAHQAGLVLKSAQVAGSSELVWEENAAKDEWTLRVDPPLPSGSAIALECWLPNQAERDEAGRRPRSEAGLAAGPIRNLPRLEPIGAEKFSGALGVRRPGGWTGRFDPLPETDPISDESFVQDWGELPEEPLTFCGTSRFVRECRASLETGPAPTRIQVKPTIQLQIESGRIVVTVDAELTELAGHLRYAEAVIPEDLQIMSVTSEGLSDWVVSSDHRLQMIFDRPISRSKRLLRVLGSIALVEDPMQLTARQHHQKTPWLWWDGLEPSVGFLTISSIAKPEMRESTGLTRISSESSGGVGTTMPRHSSTYRVDDPRRLGEILWETVPPRVSVSIESQITIHPDSAEWVAVLRYDVIGGALDAIYLKMPAAWSAGATLHLSNGEYQLTTETRGADAFWTITPERPIWGSQRFVLRSSRRLEHDKPIVHPEITPRGKGVVDAYLSIINATGQPLAIANAVGLQSIPYASRFHAREFATFGGTAVGAFRVVKDAWTVSVDLPKIASRDMDSWSSSAQIAFAETSMVIMPDRSSLGRAVYDTVPGTGPNLSFELPPGGTLLWATIDFNPAIPLRSSSGTWSILCDNRRSSRIGLIWRTEPDTLRTMRSTSTVGIPRAGAGLANMLVSIYTPPGFTVNRGDSSGLEIAGMARLEMARADWLARSASDLVAKIDRSSGRDHEKLVSLLINHEMALRGALRSIQATDPARTKVENGRFDNDFATIESARAARNETIVRAGLEEDLAAAQTYLGAGSRTLARPLVGVPEPSASDRIRFLGRPTTLIGLAPGVDVTAPPILLKLESRPWDVLAITLPIQAIVTVVLVGGIALATIAIGRWAWQGPLALSAAIALAAYTGGPAMLAMGLALALAGSKAARG